MSHFDLLAGKQHLNFLQKIGHQSDQTIVDKTLLPVIPHATISFSITVISYNINTSIEDDDHSPIAPTISTQRATSKSQLTTPNSLFDTQSLT